MGPYDTEVRRASFDLRTMPIVTVLGIPYVILSIIAFTRNRLVPAAGSDALCPQWMVTAFLISAQGLSAAVALFGAIGVALVCQFWSFGAFGIRWVRRECGVLLQAAARPVGSLCRGRTFAGGS